MLHQHKYRCHRKRGVLYSFITRTLNNTKGEIEALERPTLKQKRFSINYNAYLTMSHCNLIIQKYKTGKRILQCSRIQQCVCKSINIVLTESPFHSLPYNH